MCAAATDGIFLARPEQPREGIPLAVKDLFDTAGLTTTYGSSIFADHVPEHTASSVSNLEATGYAVAGKTNLHEFAYGITSQNPHFGTVPNPLRPGRLAGGSSGGTAAALAAGLADAGLGTDSGGSIRLPAACCGIAGFKPSHGLVAIDGCFPLAPSFDTVGPMARTMGDCTRMMSALAPELEPPQLDSFDDLVVGVAWTGLASAGVRERVETAAALFPQRQELDLPFADDAAAVFRREVAEVHEPLFAAERERYGDNLRTKVELALATTDADHEAGVRGRQLHREAMAQSCRELDLLITPTLAYVAPGVDRSDLELRESMIRFTFPFNALGWPAAALPCGTAELGLPASLQLVSPRGDDALVLAAGELLERRLAAPAS